MNDANRQRTRITLTRRGKLLTFLVNGRAHTLTRVIDADAETTVRRAAKLRHHASIVTGLPLKEIDITLTPIAKAPANPDGFLFLEDN